MLAKRSAKLLLLLVLSTVPALALARASSDTMIPTSAQFSELEWAALQEIKVLANAQISVRDAIEIAQKRAAGAKAVDVSFDGQADRLAYRVKTYRHAVHESASVFPS